MLLYFHKMRMGTMSSCQNHYHCKSVTHWNEFMAFILLDIMKKPKDITSELRLPPTHSESTSVVLWHAFELFWWISNVGFLCVNNNAYFFYLGPSGELVLRWYRENLNVHLWSLLSFGRSPVTDGWHNLSPSHE